MRIQNVSELINPGEQLISLTGGGGKTSLMYLLARELAEAGKRVVSTTTTRIFPPHRDETGGLSLEIGKKGFSTDLKRRLDKTGHITAAHRYLPGVSKLEGVTAETAQDLPRVAAAAHVIIEADGAARKSLKAPDEHEPVIPEKTDVCIAVMGLDALGKPLEKRWVFRPEIVSQLTGIELGTTVTATCMARLAVLPGGLFKGCPESARRIVFLNKMDLPEAERGAHHIIRAAKKLEGTMPDLWCIASIHEGRYKLVY
ncbi:selenium cofactor biosynthesis protein YqeC [Pseudodesulfovibrio senegalensis]|jgi:probable selenium-dependent hydroxylase accessory protein YqeC|uniref:Putative selenium-dependent hydroxylase accessory protein YqeC n=1 Tax=Pseudodesulfovibrio senegalensis TaxID=1721087 RepID=A0A6N6N5V0_9BACT|nr:selenium cofactor biosynthesis protein YqeC [Pseudodesulfovibrio senegalensis]KAB1443118.1 putative selenium-dependent hydroxylase accessory protein YqeC [Pseudodesulfovibrio senegalensis]